MLKKAHNFFAILSFLIIALFWTSTLIGELFFEYENIAQIKSLIVCPGLLILIPAIAITAITGNKLAQSSKKKELIAKKRKRMPFIAILGVFVLLPCAIYLNSLASDGVFDTAFYIVQTVELLAGATNLYLMFLNIYQSKNQ